MRLLSVSRSFCSHVPEMGRYKLSRRGALPDFGRSGDGGAAGRRVTQAELPMGERRQGGEGFGRAPAATGQTTFGGTEPVQGPGRLLRATTPVRASVESESKPERWSRFKQWLGSWVRGWSGWLRRGSKRRPKRAPVQTGFMLETVRVVRNDLAEADLELVVLKSKRGKAKAEAGGKVPEREGGRPLSQVAAKLFTSGRSR